MTPAILGILNLSPESPVKDSVAANAREVMQRTEYLLKHGAVYIDTGARSSSRSEEDFTEEMEFSTLLPAIKLLKKTGCKISIDTWSPLTAVRCLNEGVDMINYTSNDYSGEFLKHLAYTEATLVMTYMPYINPIAMRSSEPVTYSIDNIKAFFTTHISKFEQAGMQNIIVDPNIGIHHPLESSSDIDRKRGIIIENIHTLSRFNCPLLFHHSHEKEEWTESLLEAWNDYGQPQYIRTHRPHIIQKAFGF